MEIARSCTTRPQEHGRPLAVPNWFISIQQRQCCLMARFWLLVVPIQRYRTTVARNYMILPQGHGASLIVSMIIMAGLFIRRRCCPMARSWLLEEPKGILFLSRRGARSYTIRPPGNGRPPATSMGSALIT